MIAKFGYARVSSADQNLDRQMDEFKKLGIEDRFIYSDKQSGKNFEREGFQSLKRTMRKGDILYIHSLDRFGRNKQDILNEWEDITKNIGADIIVLDMPLLDTTKHKDSLGTLISDLILQILSWIAEDERERIRKRQREGIESAKRNGKHLGRPRTEISPEFEKVYHEWKEKKIKGVEAFAKLCISKVKFYQLVKEFEFNAIYEVWARKGISDTLAAQQLNISVEKFYEMIKRYEDRK